MDEKFEIKKITGTENPQKICWIAMHQDHSDKFAGNYKCPSEEKAGEFIIKHCLAGDRGHYGILEHPQITLACGYFPHSVIQQLRTHRIGITFDVQSFRYNKNNIISVADEIMDIESVFYIRPVGNYGNFYYNDELRKQDLIRCLEAAKHYRNAVNSGMPIEQARGLLPFDYRQHFVMSCNARSLMHILDLRWKKDCQIEIQWFAELLFISFSQWMPQISNWYFNHRSHKARLSP